ncbi:MAG: hypothetical protein J7484_11980 [Microbacterium sp.]|nr:hypothetical protein [Microbacterium sp.]
MGQLIYGGNRVIELDDEVLAHLRSVTFTKLRRNESFALTVPGPGGGCEALWIHAAIPLRFMIDERASLNRPFLVDMMAATNSAGGLDLTSREFAPRQADAGLQAISA